VSTRPRRVYTDGACRGNPGPGGWAWAEPGGEWASGADSATTNQRMEITAALRAAERFDDDLVIVSDSTYVVHCWRDRWWEGWIRRGWRNASKQPIANQDLWEQLVPHLRDRPGLRFEWVKGHSGDEMNDLVDRLAVRAAATGRGESGGTPPSEDQLGAPDAPRGGGSVAADPTARDGRVPVGWRLAVVGLRSAALAGSPAGAFLVDRLAQIMAAQAELHPDLVVLSGLRPGAEELGARAAVAADVPYVAVLPYPDPTAGWAEVDAARFARLCDEAVQTVVLERTRPADVAGRQGALARRDGWLRSVCDSVVAVSDGIDADAELVRDRFERALTERGREGEVWHLDLPEV
jgi:ribonuclease HI